MFVRIPAPFEQPHSTFARPKQWSVSPLPRNSRPRPRNVRSRMANIQPGAQFVRSAAPAARSPTKNVHSARFLRVPINRRPGAADRCYISMASQPSIPRADAAFRDFATVFCRGIHANPALYMMTSAEADSLLDDFNRFDAAYGIAIDPEMRTRQAIFDKQDARSILENNIRLYAAFIKPNRGIDDGEKVNIGIAPINVSHSKRVCPSEPPLLKFIGSVPGIDELRYAHSQTPTSKRKPHGAARLELRAAYSGPGEPLPKVSEALPIGSFTQSRMLVPQELEKLARGLRPTYYARWAGFSANKGANISAWSLPASMAIAMRTLQKPAEPKQQCDGANNAENDGDSSLKWAA